MKKLYDYYLKLNNKIKKIMHFGFLLCLILLVTSSLVLITYDLIYMSPIIYYIGYICLN